MTPDVQTTLEQAQTIAVVGCSPRATRTSHRIAQYLKRAGYRVIPVNPHCDEMLGERCYPDVQHIPPGTQIDIVNIFRRSNETADMIRDVIERVEQTGKKPVIWTQLGVSSPEAEKLAKEAGLPYLRNRCIMVDHSQLGK